MSVAGLIFEPRLPNFENQYNFWRCLNGIKTNFWCLYLFQIFRKSVWVSSPFLKLVLALEYVRSHHNLRKNGYLHLQARILFVLSCFPIVPRECYFLARNVLCTKDNLVANYFGSVGKDLAQIAPSSMRKKGKVAGRGPQNGANASMESHFKGW